MRYFISLSYVGTNFCGWQKQSNGLSVQEELERALQIILKEKISVIGAGRTDAGVHAINYVAHFDTNTKISNSDYRWLVYKLNAILSNDISIFKICEVDSSCHARFDAINRTYRYNIHLYKDPFLNNMSYFCPFKLEIEKMNRSAKLLLGRQDFTSFAKLHSNTNNNICTVSEAHLHYQNEGQLCFTVSANRFLRNMVRAMVGSIIEVGRGKKEEKWILEMIQSKDRCAAGSSVPAHALFLVNIEYPYPLFDTMTLSDKDNRMII